MKPDLVELFKRNERHYRTNSFAVGHLPRQTPEHSGKEPSPEKFKGMRSKVSVEHRLSTGYSDHAGEMVQGLTAKQRQLQERQQKKDEEYRNKIADMEIKSPVVVIPKKIILTPIKCYVCEGLGMITLACQKCAGAKPGNLCGYCKGKSRVIECNICHGAKRLIMSKKMGMHVPYRPPPFEIIHGEDEAAQWLRRIAYDLNKEVFGRDRV